MLSPAALARHQRAAQAVYVDRRVMEYAVALTTATRERGEQNWVEFGASPRGSINLVHAGRALALLRGRDYVLPTDVRDLARDVLRHRIVLTYEALAAGVDADRVLDDVLEQVPVPRIELADDGAPAAMSFREPLLLAGLVLVPLALARLLASRSAGAGATRSATRRSTCSRASRARRAAGTCRRCSRCSRSPRSAIALARPERTVAVEQRQGTVMLVHDTSGSMQATDVAPDRLSAAREAARTLVRSLPEEFRLGVDLLQHARRAGVRADHRPLAGAARARRARRSRAARRWATACGSASTRSARR